MQAEFQTETKIFIGGLSSEIPRDDLLQYLGFFGPVDFLNIVKQKDTKKWLGFAFARYKTAEGTMKLLSKQHHQLGNRTLEIQAAKERHEKKNYTRDLKNRKIFVKGLPINIDQQQLEAFFSQMAKIRSAYSITEPGSNKGVGYGFVVFQNGEDAQRVLEKKTFQFAGRQIYCVPYKSKSEQKAQMQRPSAKTNKKKMAQLNKHRISLKKTRKREVQVSAGTEKPASEKKELERGLAGLKCVLREFRGRTLGSEKRLLHARCEEPNYRFQTVINCRNRFYENSLYCNRSQKVVSQYHTENGCSIKLEHVRGRRGFYY